VIKRVIVLAAVCLLLIPSVYADVIVEPDNNFYNRHRSSIIYLGRSFAANGADGFAAVKSEPGAGREIAKLQNGETTYLQYSCLYDGSYWGFTLHHSGWVNIDEMLVLYDYVAFEEEHLHEFYLYDGDYAEIRATRSAAAWPWPGADAPLWTFEDLDTDNFRVSNAYKDSDGREWGFVTYLYGSRNVWFCLSDPLNRGIPAFNPAPPPMPWDSDTEHTDIEKNNNSMLVVIVVLVAALVIGTAVLIRVFWKPGRVETGGDADD
jgi:hypothetical protein